MRIREIIKCIITSPLKIRNEIVYPQQPDTFIVYHSALIHAYSGLYVDAKKNLIHASCFHREKLPKLISISRFIRKRKSLSAASIGHGPWNNYYHWYIDSLPRLWALKRVTLTKNIELFISQSLSRDERDLLQALVGQNIKIHYVSRFTLVVAREVYYLPFLSESCNAELPAPYLDFYQRVAFSIFPQSPPATLFKIFISRAGSGRRIFINQVEVESVMEKHGYTILRLETLTLSQQIYYFRFAERVVASHGAGLTNLLYASKSSVLEIFHSDEILGHYRGLCKGLGLKYTYMSLSGKHKDETVYLPVEDLKDWISQ